MSDVSPSEGSSDNERSDGKEEAEDDAQSLYDEAMTLRDAGKFAEAVEKYEASKAKGNESCDLYNNMAICFIKQNDFDNAIANYRYA